MSDFNLLGIDPGSYTTGIGIIHVSNGIINDYTSLTIDVSRLYYPYQSRDPMIELNAVMLRILEQYDPYMVAIETPFIYASRPTAIIPLAKANGAIESAILTYDKNINIQKYAPRAIKAYHKVEDHKDKESTRKALKLFEPFKHLSNINEHEVDALCVAHLLYKNIYP